MRGVQMDNLMAAFESGLTFDDYAADLRVHRGAFTAQYERLAPIVDELQSDPPLKDTRVLAITEDWCVDSVFHVPIAARFAEASPGASLRIVRRSSCRHLADAFPGRGGVSRVPTLIFLDDASRMLGHWSERCASEHRRFETFTKDHPMPELDIRAGVPARPLMSWMELRIASEWDRCGGIWREMRDEVFSVLQRSGDRTWHHEFSIETTAGVEAIWALFRDVRGWKDWNAGIESIELDGPFAEGTWFTMKPPGQDALRSKLIDVRPNECFVDETRVGDLVVQVSHHIGNLGPHRARVTYAITAIGTDAPQIGAAVASDFPEVLAALVSLAEGRRS